MRLGRAVPVLLAVVTLSFAGAIVATAGAYHAATVTTPSPISEQEAVADARKALADGGAGYTVVATHFEPTSKHFDYSFADSQGFGEDQVRECLVIPPLPPLPFLTPCRYYPVWLVELRSESSDVVIAINARTGCFGGGGGAGIVPGGGDSEPSWWQPVWG
jgi:hypothetical protein